MGLFERSVLSDPGLRASLPEGESPLAYFSVAQIYGAERSLPLGTEPDPPGREGLLDFVTGSWMPRWARGDRVERLLGGVALWGVPGSDGARLHAALAQGSGLVVTERSLIVTRQDGTEWIDDPKDGGKRVMSLQYRAEQTFPRDHLVTATRAPRLAGRGRVELSFRDHSMCAVMTGLISTRPARRLIETLGL